MIKYILVSVCIFASANTKANEMPVLPNGSRLKTCKRLKNIRTFGMGCLSGESLFRFKNCRKSIVSN